MKTRTPWTEIETRISARGHKEGIPRATVQKLLGDRNIHRQWYENERRRAGLPYGDISKQCIRIWDEVHGPVDDTGRNDG
jgi:hypothetical protein